MGHRGPNEDERRLVEGMVTRAASTRRHIVPSVSTTLSSVVGY